MENNRMLYVNLYMNSIPQFLTSLANISVLLIGALLIFDGSFTVGMLLAFQGFIAQFIAPAMTLTAVSSTIRK